MGYQSLLGAAGAIAHLSGFHTARARERFPRARIVPNKSKGRGNRRCDAPSRRLNATMIDVLRGQIRTVQDCYLLNALCSRRHDGLLRARTSSANCRSSAASMSDTAR
jgi:hypothetical protein